MQKENAIKHFRKKPLRLPTTLEGLERAVLLLGNRGKGELKDKLKSELKKLVGAYPSVEEAVAWKQILKAIRKEKVGRQNETSVEAPPSNLGKPSSEEPKKEKEGR